MKTIRVVADLTYDDSVMHGEDEEEQRWFFRDVLMGDDPIIVHSNFIGDSVGTLKIIGTVGGAQVTCAQKPSD